MCVSVCVDLNPPPPTGVSGPLGFRGSAKANEAVIRTGLSYCWIGAKVETSCSNFSYLLLSLPLITLNLFGKMCESRGDRHGTNIPLLLGS